MTACLARSSSPSSPTTQSRAKQRFSGSLRIAPNWPGFGRAFCLCKLSIGFQGPFRRLCLCPAKSRFPTAETGIVGDSVRILGQCEGRRSISCCRDHSGGKSVRRATPMPCGSRPSTAATSARAAVLAALALRPIMGAEETSVDHAAQS
jgi:hypothetical protein